MQPDLSQLLSRTEEGMHVGEGEGLEWLGGKFHVSAN